MEKCKFLVYKFVGSIGIEFSWEDLPTNLPILVARGEDPLLTITGIESANSQVGLDSYIQTGLKTNFFYSLIT